MTVVGRLAPTPSGELHLGNALAFGAAWLSARGAAGRILLRVEDLDRGRARVEIADGQRFDLGWLGIDWDEEVSPQSKRSYGVHNLDTYRCVCSRALRRACACRDAGHATGAWRLRLPDGDVLFQDRALGAQRVGRQEDPVLMRTDGEAAYPLAVVVDDARDGVTEVVRGADLLEATAAQLALHRALGLRPPTYLHAPVLLGPDGRKLSKSHGSTSIASLRSAGWSALRVWETLLPVLGLPPGPLASGLSGFDPSAIPPGPRTVGADGGISTG